LAADRFFAAGRRAAAFRAGARRFAELLADRFADPRRAACFLARVV
jgi:hypothetical protein